jgi:hypothetical protein
MSRLTILICMLLLCLVLMNAITLTNGSSRRLTVFGESACPRSAVRQNEVLTHRAAIR